MDKLPEFRVKYIGTYAESPPFGNRESYAQEIVRFFRKWGDPRGMEPIL
jgi:hypothetical protein